MWYVAPESNIQNKQENVSETWNPNESGSLPEYATLQLPDDFSILFIMKETEETTKYTKYLCIRYQRKQYSIKKST